MVLASFSVAEEWYCLVSAASPGSNTSPNEAAGNTGPLCNGAAHSLEVLIDIWASVARRKFGLWLEFRRAEY